MPKVPSHITLLLLFLLVFSLVYGWRMVTQTEGTATDTTLVASCDYQEIDQIHSIVEAVSVGDAYFTDDDRYNRACARYAYERAIAISPDTHPQVWYQLGRLDFLEGKFDAAIFKFLQQEDYFGSLQPSVHYMLGLTYGYRASREDRGEDWSKAEQAFLRYLEIYPHSSWARTDLAWVYFAQGKYQAMRPVLEVGISYEPHHPWLLNMYGLALLNTDEPDMALAYFELASEKLEPLTPETWGRAYPGNHPESWTEGLEEMRQSVKRNIAAAQARLN